jgi:hypothetical protein
VRTGIFISAGSHVALAAFVLLGTPKLFENVPLQTIEVDLVRAQELEPQPEPPKEPEKKPPEKSADWNLLPEASSPQAKPVAPETPPAKAKQPPVQQARAPQTPAESPRQTPQKLPDPPAQSPQQPADPPAQTSQPWIFDPVNIPALMNLPNAPQSDFDAEATAAANLSLDDKSAFKAHLKKCWKLPDGVSAAQSTRVTLRIFLKRDGGLAAEPMLIEASASRDGPLLMQAAIRSVKDCQPFAFLPVDRYREWRTLDVSFSPKEMAGG